ncbi:hypothetical protein ABID99_001526 [Mucilaginibacter sp. OAE612]
MLKCVEQINLPAPVILTGHQVVTEPKGNDLLSVHIKSVAMFEISSPGRYEISWLVPIA